MKIDLGCSDDYAHLGFGDMVYYYGYEYTNEDEVGEDDSEWCFVVRSNDRKVLFKKTHSQLMSETGKKKGEYGYLDMWDCRDLLIIGMCLFMNRLCSIEEQVKKELIVDDKIRKVIDVLFACTSDIDDIAYSLVEEFTGD